MNTGNRERVVFFVIMRGKPTSAFHKHDKLQHNLLIYCSYITDDCRNHFYRTENLPVLQTWVKVYEAGRNVVYLIKPNADQGDGNGYYLSKAGRTSR